LTLDDHPLKLGSEARGQVRVDAWRLEVLHGRTPVLGASRKLLMNNQLL
jgi:hypothetical protein